MKFHLFIVLLLLVKPSSAKTIIKTLPGYNRVLDFTLETGYVGVENEEKQLFYYFVESQRDPETDPLWIWINGGLSSLWGFFFGSGPLKFDTTFKYDKTIPTLLDNENSWTKFMNILYVDGPAGTGFSYSTGSYNTSNYHYASNLNNFIHKWLLDHEKFQSHPIYVSSDGFGGNFLPIVVEDIQKDNANGIQPIVNLKGYMMIGGGADFNQDFNARYTYANRVGLIPDDIFEPAYQSCNGSYRDPPNEKCKAQMVIIDKLVEKINTAMWTDAACAGDFETDNSTLKHRALQEKMPSDFNILNLIDVCPDDSPPAASYCPDYIHGIINVWANFEGVPEALGTRPGAKACFLFYNKVVDEQYYNKTDVQILVPFHQRLSNTKLDVLIMCGDLDMDIPCLSTEKWIKTLNVTLAEQWRPWSILANETTGYTRKFTNGDFYTLTYSVVKGGGHFIPEYKPAECYNMVRNWTQGFPL